MQILQVFSEQMVGLLSIFFCNIFDDALKNVHIKKNIALSVGYTFHEVHDRLQLGSCTICIFSDLYIPYGMVNY